MIVTNSLTGGGAERAMNLLSNELISRDFSVVLVPINSSKEDLISPKCQIFELGRNHKSGIVGTLWALFKFHRIVHIFSPDVIVLNCDLPELFGLLLLGSRKMIVVEHSNPAWTTRLSLGRLVRKLLVKRNVMWAAVSSHLNIWGLDALPAIVLPNILLPSHEILPELEIEKNLQRIIYIGRLETYQKRPHFMLEIAKLVEFPVIVIGEGEAKLYLEELTRSLNLDVRFQGFVSNPWSFVKSGDLLVVPSAWEGDGLVVVEGIQKNLPILLADIPDFRRFGFQREIYCTSVEDFVERINTFKYSLSTLQISESKKASILENRKASNVGRVWENLLIEK